MSEWHQPKSADIELDLTNKEVDIRVTANAYGNIYVSLTFNQIKSLFNKIEALEKEHAA